MNLDPKPRSPERITVLPDISARYDNERGVLVTFTVRYEEWCCAETHELVDAIATVVETLEGAAHKAAMKRRNKNNRELKAALDSESPTRRDDEELGLF